MVNLWLKIRIWTKVVLGVLALVYVVVFSVKNSETKPVTFWYMAWMPPVTTSVLKLVLAAFFCGVMVAVLGRTAIRTVSQVRELRARKAVEQREREMDELKAKAGMIRTRPEAVAVDPPMASPPTVG